MSKKKPVLKKKLSKKKKASKLKLPLKRYGVTFEKKGSFQKRNCIARAFGGECRRVSTLQAVRVKPDGGPIMMIRCCDAKECMRFAAEIARA